jgi:peptidoglycan/LPS O-acetylase OafA/YrhL
MSDSPTAAPHLSPEARARSRRRRRRVVVAVVLGAVVAAYTYGALAERVIAEDRNDLLPEWMEAVLLGAAVAAGSLPVAWSIVARAIIPIPTLILYLTVFLGKNPPLPFYAAFVMALIYAGALTVLADYLADRPDRSRLGSRH